MELRPLDRLMLAMLCDIYDALPTKGETDTKFLREVIYGGHEWALSWEMSGITDVTPVSRETAVFVSNVLDMYSFIEEAWERLEPADHKDLPEHRAKFPGFDGNHESDHLSVARLLVDHMDRFQRFKGRINNSHHETLSRYSQMYAVFEPIRMTLGDRKVIGLTFDELKRVLEA